jgi:glycerol-3-phosphate dehydrogenase
LGEYRFCVFELQRRVLTEAQSDRMFSLRKQIVLAAASFEALERYRSRELIAAIVAGLESKLAVLQSLWSEANVMIRDADEFENALDERQLVGYAMLELKILTLHRRLLNLNVKNYEYRLRKTDIYLRSIIYLFAVRFQYKEEQIVAPEEFFWRRTAANIS